MTGLLVAYRIEVNFSHELTELIREARALDRLGFAIPESTLHVVLQSDRLLIVQEILSAMLADYYKVNSPKIYKNLTGTITFPDNIGNAASYSLHKAWHRKLGRLWAGANVQVLKELTPIEHSLLTFQLEKLHKTLLPGITVLNWHSLGVPEFVTSVRKVICQPLCKMQALS